MSPKRATFHFVASLVVTAVVTAFVPPAGATTSVTRTGCSGEPKALPTLTAEIASERRQYRSTGSARVDVLVTRRIDGFDMPVPDVEVRVLLSQGSMLDGRAGATDESGSVVIAVPLERFHRGHLDVRAFAWKGITPSGWQCPEIGEAGQALALDLFRIVGK